jgi:flagellar protein FliS
MSAVQGASAIGLVIVLFDTLADDLRRAAAALRKNDIEERCRHLNHGVLVLGQLEAWLDPVGGGESALTLAAFYASLRTQMMKAAVTRSAEILEAAIDTISNVRTAWQKLDAEPPAAFDRSIDPTNSLSTPARETEMERVPFSLSG